MNFELPSSSLDYATMLENCLLARYIWKNRVTPDSVVPRLEFWRCGFQACFGGHIATWPEFLAIPGADVAGAQPHINLDFGVDIRLFGRGMFFAAEPRDETDHQIVLNRLDQQIEILKGLLHND